MADFKKIIVLTADKDSKALIDKLFPRIPTIENLPNFEHTTFVHQYRDPGVLNNSSVFLRAFINQFDFAFSILDLEGCGRHTSNPEDVENEIQENLERNGWKDRCAAICIAPELEQWLWVTESHMKKAINWNNDEGISKWLMNKGFLFSGNKPKRPKEAFESLLLESEVPKSSSIFSEIGENASYKFCNDRSFLKLLDTLRSWISS